MPTLAKNEKSFDPLTPAQRSERMSRVRSKNTKPELVIRKLVWSLGYRYRLHSKKLPGRPDLVFPSRKKVIFIHGCFWHQHGENCRQYRMPRSKLDFWLPKLESNKKRDALNQQALNELGWNYLVVWECQLKDKETLTSRIVDFLEDKA
jgi:DNA mismatch endonuclease (patch repair protein)